MSPSQMLGFVSLFESFLIRCDEKGAHSLQNTQQKCTMQETTPE
jgi:hypothetical protein